MSLAVEGLTVRRRGHPGHPGHRDPVLHDVSFVVADGSVIGVGGPSGSGKTTLLMAIAGLVRPSAGRIEVAGVPSSDFRARARVIGYVGSSTAVEDDLTPTEHLAFHASLRGIGRSQRGGLVAGLIELLDLGTWRDTPGRLLTDGLRRRLAIARALLHDPSVVLLDDPARGLDPAARVDLVDLIAGLSDAGRTVVVAGGDLDDFAPCLTDLAVLEGGRLVAFGEPEAVLGDTQGSRLGISARLLSLDRSLSLGRA